MQTQQPKDMGTSIAAVTATPTRGKPTGLRKWIYRLLAMTLVPAGLFVLLEFSLRVCGYGYPTAFFLDAPSDMGRGNVVENYRFGLRFFPPALLRNPLPVFFAHQKPAGTYRIFVIGESAAMGFPDPTQNFGHLLEVMLSESYPATRFEVINTSMTSINSHVALPIARDCANHQPDLFIVHLGNNEVVGPFGAAGVIGPYTPSLALIHANLLVKTTRTGQLLGNILKRFRSTPTTPQDWQGMKMFLQSQVRADDDRLPAIYDNHRANVRAICDVGIQGGATVLVCTIPVNLGDSAPFASLHRADLSATQQEEWDRLYQEGCRLESGGDVKTAIDRFQVAATIDDHHADLQFRLGRGFLAMGRLDQAREHFLKARDEDALRFRTDSTMNANLRDLAGNPEREGVHLVDAERIFADASPGGIPGENYFLEHVHMNFSGNHLLARSLFEKIVDVLPASVKGAGSPRPPPTEKQCEELLAYNDWNRHYVVTQIQTMMATAPPFTAQLDAAERDRRWKKRADELEKILPAAKKSALTDYARVLERRPQDIMLRRKYADLLMLQFFDKHARDSDRTADANKAIEQYQKLLDSNPHDYFAHARLGDLARNLLQLDKAISHYRQAIAMQPDQAMAYSGLALALGATGKIDEALALHQGRVSSSPNRAAALLAMADFLMALKKHDEARQQLTEALRIDPEFDEAHAMMGALLAQQGKFSEAIQHYEEALRLRPGSSNLEAELKNLRARVDAQK